jgi:hypothetical protein
MRAVPLLLLLASSPLGAPKQVARPNIIFIMVRAHVLAAAAC